MKDVVTNSWEETEYYLDVQYVAHTAHINSLKLSYYRPGKVHTIPGD
jgi:hypothetical protein